MTLRLNLSHVSLQRGDTQVLADVVDASTPADRRPQRGAPSRRPSLALPRADFAGFGRVRPVRYVAFLDPAGRRRIGLASAAVAASRFTRSVLNVRSAATSLMSLMRIRSRRSARARSWTFRRRPPLKSSIIYSTLSEGEEARRSFSRAHSDDPECFVLRADPPPIVVSCSLRFLRT